MICVANVILFHRGGGLMTPPPPTAKLIWYLRNPNFKELSDDISEDVSIGSLGNDYTGLLGKD